MKTIRHKFRLAAAITALLFLSLTAPAAFFSSDTTIGVNNTSYEGQDIVVYNCKLTVDGRHTFSDVLLVNNATLTHTYSSNGVLQIIPASPPYYINTGLNLVISNNLVVEAGSVILADGKGFGGGMGSGAGGSLSSDFPYGPPFFYTSGGGGAYGGFGGLSLGEAAGGNAYGLVLSPTNSGSGGGAGSGVGGSGGGSIILAVGGNILVDGTITANGANGTNSGSGGGSGGGIWLSAQSIEGGGSISANGGAGEMSAGGGGGGGRVAIYATTNDFVGTVTALGGLGAVSGGAGTIYTMSANLGNTAYGQVLVDNGGEPGTNTAVDVSEPFDLNISGGAVVPLSSATLGSLSIASNSWLLGTSGSGISLNLKLNGNATILAGGGVLADGEGNGSLGTGIGTGGTALTNSIITGGGGGYGGYGGASPGVTQKTGGNSYGSAAQPNVPGSGGGTGTGTSPYNLGGSGGGAIVLSVAGLLQLGGAISANGSPGFGEASGGGSGGAVWLTTGSISGNGNITANGGSGQLPLGGGGGGGRIAIYSGTNQFAGRISAYGGAGYMTGGAGTIYNAFPGVPQVVADNGGQRGTNTGLGTLTSTFDLVITNGAVLVPTGTLSALRNLTIAANSFLTVSQAVATLQFTATGNVTIQPGGGILVDGDGYAGGSSGPGIGGTGLTNGISTGCGGGHGGYGGTSAGGGPGGITYDSIITPTQFGSPGGSSSGISPFNFGGSGGGSISLTISGTLQVGGSISANGNPGVGQGSGGGSGGAIRLTVGQLSGSGIISANGGAGESTLGGGGGGGRIAITFYTNQFTGILSAHGGGGFAAGGAGTIYAFSNFNQIGLIILDNGGLQGTNTPLTEIGSTDLTITNGAAVSISPGTTTTIRNLVIASNSFITVTAPSQSSSQLTMTGNATIQSGGGIIFDGLGTVGGTSGQGSGSSYLSNGVTMGGGGGYGGNGGGGASGVAGGIFFGSLTQPVNAGGSGGNGGGTSLLNAGGSGGGMVHVTVTGTLLVAGKVSANGTAGVGQGSGGGAGGSVWLTAGALSGNGIISANGGAGETSLGGGGGGSGGRVAIYLNTNLFTGLISAYGGAGFVPGGAGTIYTKSNNNSFAQVVLDNGGLSGAITPFQPSGSFDLTVTNGAVLGATASVTSLRNLLVASNSVITLYTNLSQLQTLSLAASGNATIQPGGAIVLDGQSISTSQLGQGGSTSVNGVITGGGGGYGGYGGGSAKGAAGGNSYGSITQSESPGSGGGAGGGTFPNNHGGYGGAGVQLNITGTLQLGGAISANGTAGVGQASGGGSGGSVWITAGGLTGGGTISANGGGGEPSLGGGGGGGGGRIALNLNTNLFTGGISAHGGSGGVRGGAGTIYMTSRTPVFSQIIADNGGQRGTNTPLSSGFEVNTLTVTNGAVVVPSVSLSFQNLMVASNSFLAASSLTPASLVLNLTGSATIQAGGGLIADGAGYSGTQTGPGSGNTFSTNASSTGAGGGYGGNGGVCAGGGPGGVSYGSATQPTQSGSNGGRGNGTSPANSGGAGGGFIQLTITGGMQLNGIISANGLTGIGEGSGGGAGGGVLISVAGTLSGNGAISANGGAGESVLGGGGGGGRIAVTYGSNQFAGNLTAYGGPGFATGGPGTIYTKLNNSQFGQLVLDGGSAPGTTTLTALLSLPTVDLTITGGAKVSAPIKVTLHNLLLNPNAVLSLAGTNGSPVSGVVVLGNATIQSGAQIVADGGGFFGNQGSGAGSFGTSLQGYSMGTGGSYGGYGGSSALSGAPGNSYGSIPQPVGVGSGGGCSTPPYSQSAGGGSVQMTVNGTLDLEGSVSANGATPLSEGCGGGSGGSVWLNVGALTGAGAISANGGAGILPFSGGGGGGRIAINYNTNQFTGAISANGGQGFVGGGAGTIYTRANSNSVGSVIVDNGSLHGANTLLSTPEAFNLTVSGSAIAQTPPTNSTLADPTLFLSSLLVQSNGSITAASANDNASLVVFGNAVVATNGAIAVDGKGYNGLVSVGPGAGMMLSNGTSSGSGGGYGGAGGASASGEPGGSTYGSSQQPIDWGSQGGVPSTSFVNFSQGGGAIRLEVAGTLTVNGAVTANGKTALFQNTGGGAGGSIWLSAGTLNGSGVITANGGAGEPVTGGGGGGGRIALYNLTNNFTGVTTASGATGASPGQNGTIFAAILPAPQIISQSPTGPVSNAVSSITLACNSQLAEFSLPLTNVTITTPNGVLPPSSLSFNNPNLYPQDASQIVISFPQQTAVGPYTIQINQPLSDMFGLQLPTTYAGSFTIIQPIIFGTIADTNNSPIAGVTLQPGGGLAATSTDVNGNYTISVPSGWTGAITPSLSGYAFIPSAVNYTNLLASVNQNFLGVPLSTFALNATRQGTNLNVTWFGVTGVSYQVLSSTDLINWQPYGNPTNGANGTINIVAPAGTAPKMFFRFSAVY